MYTLALLLELLRRDQSLRVLIELPLDALDCCFGYVLLPCLCAPALALHGFGGAWLAFLSLGFLWRSAVAKQNSRGHARGHGQRGESSREWAGGIASPELLSGFAELSLTYADTARGARAARAARAGFAPARATRPRRPPSPSALSQQSVCGARLGLSPALALSRYALAWAVGLFAIDAVADFSLSAP